MVRRAKAISSTHGNARPSPSSSSLTIRRPGSSTVAYPRRPSSVSSVDFPPPEQPEMTTRRSGVIASSFLVTPVFSFYFIRVPPPRRTWKSDFTGLPTARTTLVSHSRLTAMCRACRRIADADLARVVEAEMGGVPLIHLRFRYPNCHSRRCDAVLSGSRFIPSAH
jgi:hypothetical protein